MSPALIRGMQEVGSLGQLYTRQINIKLQKPTYKIYQNGPEKKGLDLKLREIAGRKAMPANDIVEKFDTEFDTAQRELDFVYFLDGSESVKKAIVKGPQDFHLSYKRPKWDIVQK